MRPPAQDIARPEQWRNAKRLIDLHMHVGMRPAFLHRAVRIMDAVGIGVGVNLSGGTVTSKDGAPSQFERNLALVRKHHPDRFVHYMNLDYGGWDADDFSARAVQQIEDGHRLGAAGLKEYKRLGLYLRDGKGRLIAIDDPKLDPVWRRCGELGMPVSIHVADPKAFWLPYDATNERWEELKDHKSWWFGDPAKYPPREALLAARNRVIARHPETTFVCVHFANNPEDIETVGRWLKRYPNMMVDLAARIPELGRHSPAKVRRLFVEHQDRILLASDFMVYGRLTLGSGGSGPPPTDEDAIDFYRKHWRWLETNDRDFAHMTPIQGDWTIDAIGLPPQVLRKIYFDNARRLLARSLPAPRVRALRVDRDFEPGRGGAVWQKASPTWLDAESLTGAARAELATEVRLLWSDRHLYLRYVCPFRQLTVFEPPLRDGERMGLWERDVVEAFVGPDPDRPEHYLEFELAPTGETLDVAVTLPEKDFAWQSGLRAWVLVDEKASRWTAEMRIPRTAFRAEWPQPGARWRLNLYRCDRAERASLAWRPTLQRSFHAPARFGFVEFAGQ